MADEGQIDRVDDDGRYIFDDPPVDDEEGAEDGCDCSKGESLVLSIDRLLEASEKITYKATTVTKDGMIVAAYAGRKKIGQITAHQTLYLMDVDRVGLVPEWRGKGIGRGMYRKASEIACEKFNLPLGNSQKVSPDATGLWKSELAAGYVERWSSRGNSGYRYKNCNPKYPDKSLEILEPD